MFRKIVEQLRELNANIRLLRETFVRAIDDRDVATAQAKEQLNQYVCELRDALLRMCDVSLQKRVTGQDVQEALSPERILQTLKDTNPAAATDFVVEDKTKSAVRSEKRAKRLSDWDDRIRGTFISEDSPMLYYCQLVDHLIVTSGKNRNAVNSAVHRRIQNQFLVVTEKVSDTSLSAEYRRDYQRLSLKSKPPLK